MEVRAVGVTSFDNAVISLDREGFLGMVFRALSSSLEETVGQQEAGGFLNLVGLALSEEIEAEYLRAAGTARLDLRATVDALIDLKRRLGGDFHVVEASDTRVVLGNRRCPFGDLAKRAPAMCMVTSHVFGHMIAESQGYGRVTLEDTIARGAAGCRIVIDLDPDAPGNGGQSYFSRTGA